MWPWVISAPSSSFPKVRKELGWCLQSLLTFLSSVSAMACPHGPQRLGGGAETKFVFSSPLELTSLPGLSHTDKMPISSTIVPAEDSHLVFLFFSQIPKIAAVMKGYCKDIYPNELQQSKRKKNNTKHQCKQNNRNEFQYHIPHLAIDIPTGRLEEGHQSPSASTWLNT